MLTRDACRTTPESFGVRRIACIVPVWATTQRTLLTCGAPLPNEAALQIMRAGGVKMHDPTLKSTNAKCWKTRFFGYLFFHVATIASGPTLPTPTTTT